MTRMTALMALVMTTAVQLPAQRPVFAAAAWSISPYVGVARHSPISPFGLALRIDVAPRFAIFGRSTVGAAWFTRQVPVPDSREFNFVLAWGGGIEIHRSASQSVEVGYKFHHLSNLYSRPQNPGLDANLFYAGWRWYLRPRT